MSTTGSPAQTAVRIPAELLEEIAAGAVSRELDRTLPHPEVAALDAAGFGALRVPVSHGGPGLGVRALIAEVIGLAAADSNVAHLYRGHFGFVESLAFQPAEIQDHWYPRILAGVTVGNASTERAGNALGTLNTVLRRDPHRQVWRVDGEKVYSTGTIFADCTRVSVARDDGGPGRRFAVVGVSDPGVTVTDDWDGFGQRLTGTGTTRLDGVEVHQHAILDRVAGGAEAVHEAAFFQLYLLAVQAGIARAALADARDLVRRRTRTFNTSAAGALFRDDPQIQQVVGEISAKAFAAEATVLRAAEILQAALDAGADLSSSARGDELPAEVLQAEVAVEQAHLSVPPLVLEVTGQLFQTVGASAVARTKALDRHWRNAQTVATHNPIVFRARALGDHEINGTLPEGLNAIGEAPGAASS